MNRQDAAATIHGRIQRVREQHPHLLLHDYMQIVATEMVQYVAEEMEKIYAMVNDARYPPPPIPEAERARFTAALKPGSSEAEFLHAFTNNKPASTGGLRRDWHRVAPGILNLCEINDGKIQPTPWFIIRLQGETYRVYYNKNFVTNYIRLSEAKSHAETAFAEECEIGGDTTYEEFSALVW